MVYITDVIHREKDIHQACGISMIFQQLEIFCKSEQSFSVTLAGSLVFISVHVTSCYGFGPINKAEEQKVV